MKFQTLRFSRDRYSDRDRRSNSRASNYTRYQSVSPVGRKRPRYSESMSRSPEAYRNKDQISERHDDSPHRSHVKSRMLREKFDRFVTSPDRRHAGTPRDYRDILPSRSHVGTRNDNRETRDRFDTSPDRIHAGTLRDDHERCDRFDISPSHVRRRKDNHGRPDRFDISPSRSHVTTRFLPSNIDEREIFDRFCNSPDRSYMRCGDDPWNVENFGDTLGRRSVLYEESVSSNSSYEQLTRSRYNRRSYSPYRSEDFNSDIGNEYGSFNQYEKRNDGNNDSAGANVQRFPVICKFYNNEGTCKRGDSCKFLHVCKYYINDNCKFGKGCIRSHNILDKQPRSILKMYDMIPDHYITGNFANAREITDLIKDKLKNIGSELHRDKRTTNSNRPLCNTATAYKLTSSLKKSSYLDRISDDETDLDEDRSEREETDATIDSSVIRSDMSEGEITDDPSQSLRDFIPLEIGVQAKVKDKDIGKKKRKKKSKKSRRCRSNDTPKEHINDKETVSQDHHEDSKTSSTVQSTVTFESQIPSRKFRVRKANDGWQISNMCDKWVNLDEADSDVFREMYKRAFEIGDKVLEVNPEQKLFDE